MQARLLCDDNLGDRPEKAPKKGSHDGRAVKASTSSTKNVVKHTSVQRQHPGMASSDNRATAHYGSVTSLTPTTDGFFLLSAGMSYHR